MQGKCVNIDVELFIQNISSWNEKENVGNILRSLIESTQKWSGKSKLKCLRKFICRYCPFVMDEPEIMTGISENWRLEDIIRILKKQHLRGKELTSKLTGYIENELVDVCSEESLRQIEKLKNKLTPEDLKDMIIMMMLQKNGRYGWEFVERISKSWTDDKLENLIKLILKDESYDDIGNGSDCGLFEIFPHLKDHVTIREVIERESDDSIGSLADFIEDDLGENDSDDSEESGVDEENDDSEESDENSEESDDSEEEIVDISSSESDSISRKRNRNETKKQSKRRKVVVIDSDSDSDYSCMLKQIKEHAALCSIV